ncbi:MAG: FAD-dependent oxidoreductase [Polyangia bacterium]
MRLAVVGAGPIGLEAALLGEARGFSVTVLEAGEVGDGLRAWGNTRAFSPVSMNLSARLLARAGAHEPAALLTGPELAALLERAAMGLDVRRRTRVLSIARARMSRRDFAGHPVRGERPFRLLVEHAGVESIVEADRVLDASGLSGGPQPLGTGVGERALVGDARVIRSLAGLNASSLAGARVALVGHGHSAAHAVGLLVDAGAEVTWLVRSAHRRPVTEVADDPLPARAAVVLRANALAESPPANLTVERRAHIESVGASPLVVTLASGQRLEVDRIVGLVGDRPDTSMLSELAVGLSPATEGAYGLWCAVSSVTDCLGVPKVRPEQLESGEPGFYLVGRKSYGRASTFLLQTGLRQLEQIFDGLAKS